MNEIDLLKQAIEEARRELDASILTEDFTLYYEKSKKLDKLIEEYIEKSPDL